MTETADKLFQMGELEKALRMLDRAIFIHDNLMGLGNEFFDHVLNIINSKALAYLDAGAVEMSLIILRKCEFMIRKRGKNCSPGTKVETFNNLGLWFRKRGLFQASIEYFDKSKQICYSTGHPPGRTLINSSAVNSVLGKYFLSLNQSFSCCRGYQKCH